MKTVKEPIQSEFQKHLQFGKEQQYNNLTIVPVFLDEPGKTKYITLEEAIRKELIEVIEKDTSGSVP